VPDGLIAICLRMLRRQLLELAISKLLFFLWPFKASCELSADRLSDVVRRKKRKDHTPLRIIDIFSFCGLCLMQLE
jgi:hypothetical protein